MNYLSKENVQEIIGLSPIQKHMLLENEESLRNILQISYEINEAIDREKFQNAWDYVVKSHSPLRTIFRKLKNRTVQIVLKERPITLQVWDLIENDDEKSLSVIAEASGKHYQKFKLSDGPLLRIGLFIISKEKSQILLTYHKSILDIWSRDLVLHDVLLVYNALKKGTTLPKLQRNSFAEYTEWSTQQDWSPAQEFWKDQLFEFEEKKLLTKEVSYKENADRIRTTTTLLSDEFIKSLNELMSSYGITSKAVILGTWSILMSLYGRENDVVFGLKSSGRSFDLTDSYNMVGQFSNNYPFKINVDSNKKVYDFLTLIHEKCNKINNYSYISLRDIESYCGISSPLNFECEIAVREKEFANNNEEYCLEEKDIKQKIDTPLYIEVIQGSSWKARFTYDLLSYPKEMIESMKISFGTILKSIAQNPTACISELNLISEDERLRLNEDFNKTSIKSPQLDILMQQVFEKQVEKNPKAIAAIYSGEKITYRELNQKSNQLAHWLRNQKFGRDDLALLFLERSIDMLIGIIAVLKAGGGYVPIDSAYPDKRLQTILNNSKAKVILTQDKLINRSLKLSDTADFSPLVFAIDEKNNETVKLLSEYSIDNPEFINKPGDIVNVFFTSGSTGQPKGAIIEHVGMLNHLWSKINLLGLNNQSIIAQNASHCFDISVWQFLAPLMVGGCAIIYNNDVSKDPKELFLNIQRDEVTVLEMVPAMMEMFIQEIEELQIETRSLSKLEYIISTGEGLPTVLSNKWLELYPNIKMINTYGATECSDDTNHLVIDKPSKSELSYIPLGQVIPNFKIYILDKYKRQVPINCIGEIGLTGIGVGRGYLGDVERTKKAFVKNPFNDGMGDRMYLTGDLGKFLPDGKLVFCGRKDFQVKVRGHRIELGEIESAILRNDEVIQCVAIIRPDISGQNRILAYVVIEKEIEESVLREFLKTQLPSYMIPEHIIVLDKLPLSTNGKVNRKMLPEPKLEKSGRKFTKPSDPIEKALVDIWEEILQQSNIGVDDNFFDIGGHSLKTIQLRSRIKQYFKVDITLKKLFEYQTISELALIIKEMKTQKQDMFVNSISKHKESDYYPLTHAQKRLFFLQHLEPNNYSYNMPAYFEVEGEINIEAFKKTFNTIIQRHNALRTNFRTLNGQPVQYISKQKENLFELIDLSNNKEEYKSQKLHEIIIKESKHCYNLEKDNLLRIKLIKLEKDRFMLILNKHHIISDKWSWNILTREFSVLYQICCNNEPNNLEPLSIQYTDYVYWVEEYMKSNQFNEDENYWINELKGNLPVLNLPTDYLRPSIMSYRGSNQVIKIDKEVYERIKEICKKHEITLFMALLSITGIFLSKLSGSEDIIIGTPEAGRNQLELEDIIGFFINTLTLRLDLSSNPTFTEMLNRVKEKTINTYEHKDYPFDLLVEKINPVRDMSRNPIFSTSFQVVNETENVDIQIEGLKFKQYQVQNNTSKFDQSISFVETKEGLDCYFEYNSDLYKETTIKRWLGYLKTMLSNICNNVKQNINDIDIMTSEEKKQLLVEWNDTKFDFPKDDLIHKLIEKQAKRNSDKIAVIYKDEKITYKQLNDRANQLARYLINQGLKTGMFVGICMDRSIEMVIGILGILKAGGVYVPMNPNYPKERLDFMLRDTNLEILIVKDTNLTWLSELNIKLICMDKEKEIIISNTKDSLLNDFSSDNLAYVIYTSGSTGTPKGVQISHNNVVNFLYSMQNKPGITNEDILFSVTSISFDIAGLEIFLPLITGAKLVIADSIVAVDGYMLSENLKNSKATIMQATPVTWRMLLETGWKNEEGIKILCGGEKMPADLARELSINNAEIWNLYGPTETTIWSTVFKINSVECNTVPIGKPINNTQVYILDKKLSPVPIGVVGELYIGGAGVSSRGYINREELTNKKFTPNPNKNGSSMYRTGDLAKYLPDGNIEFLGRIDNQVKIRGFRIELGEIENVLIEYSKLKEVAVIDREDSNGVKALAAYVVPKDGQEIATVELYNYVKRKLPEYMVPSWFIVLKELPLTANRKIDYLSLPSPNEAVYNSMDKANPRDKIELEMLRIWQDVLKIENISIFDNFFTIGGNSMIVMILMDKINNYFNIELPLSQLFYSQTIAELSEVIRGNTKISNECVIPIQKGSETNNPLFLIHPHGGGAYCYYDLVRALGTERTVYGIQSVGMYSNEEPISSISLIAKRYLQEIRRVSPKGPYNIAGWSFGGIVAFEVARRLEFIGEEVEFLGILDAQLPIRIKEEKADIEEKLPFYIEYAMLIGIDKIQLQGLNEEKVFEYVLNYGKKVKYFPQDTTIEAVRNIMKIMINNSLALKKYHYEGKIESDIHLYYVKEEAINPEHSLINPQSWYENTSGELYLTAVAGNHNTMLQRPNVVTLAEKIKESLKKLRASKIS
ncbi:amino acid adenylation domain-containing protein [Abyssisolibacter fermentans]|uniref:amino acid adenylation domain-containing protein n=1 Tax=Abyssisolibacter fermentans TaxID=1766203 RepID=UPI00082F7E8E|nr:non-ribosomal peptide synthetase [Abyssisolibacter fermentans]